MPFVPRFVFVRARKVGLALALGCLLFHSVCSPAEVNEKEKFKVRVIKIKSAEEGCAVRVQSGRVRYEISSRVSGDCAMLRAGEDYKVFVSSFHPKDRDSTDNSKDVVLMIIENNNARGKYGVFTLNSQEVRDR